MTPEEFAEYCDGITKALDTGDFQPELQQLKPIIRNAIGQNFASKSTADGSAWLPRKDKEPHPLLDLTGKMKNAAVQGGDGAFEDRGPNHLTIGIDGGEIPYAAVQEMGNEIIPSRSYFQVNEQTVDECAEIMANLLARKIFGEG